MSEEGKFVVVLGRLHIEMALWSTMGDLLLGSGVVARSPESSWASTAEIPQELANVPGGF